MFHLYVHTPFCKSKCAYCDFYSLPGIDKYADLYAEALSKEWLLRNKEIDVYENGTIYFGGGTPSALPLNIVEGFSEWLPQKGPNDEFTVEVNPEDVERDMLYSWKALGVNRVSMGVQSLNDDELHFVGRRHNGQQALKAYENIAALFDNISVDIILGLPGQKHASLKKTLSQIISLKPKHISVYILGYEPGTRLYAMRLSGKVNEVSEDNILIMYRYVCEALSLCGYEHYEISNFAIPGFSAVHNSSYWNNEPYLGLGPAAHSYTQGQRKINPSNITVYLKSLTLGETAFVVEEESPEDLTNNLIMTGLRTSKGLNLDILPENHRKQVLANLDKVAYGRVAVNGSIVTIPESQWLVSDDTISRLFVD